MTPDPDYYKLITPIIVTTVILVTSFGLLHIRLRARNSQPSGIPSLGNVHATHDFVLTDKIKVSPNVFTFRFALPTNEHILGLPIGRHVIVCADICNPLTGEGPKQIMRQYTPVTSDFTHRGHFDLLVKVYWKNDHPQFPEGGWMSQHLASLPVGASVAVKGPGGRIEYLERGVFKLGRTQHRYTRVGMIAGGTGITPMYQLINHVLETRKGKDSLHLSLLFGNQHPSDILLREELESFARDHPAQFDLSLTVDRASKEDNWSGFTGYVTKEMIEATLPAPGPKVLMLLCGPPPMVRSVEAQLLALGHAKHNIHAF